jgi:hypothetical protein
MCAPPKPEIAGKVVGRSEDMVEVVKRGRLILRLRRIGANLAYRLGNVDNNHAGAAGISAASSFD